MFSVNGLFLAPADFADFADWRRSAKSAGNVFYLHSMKETATINLHITLEQPPAGVDFALPKGKGNDHILEQLQRSNGGNLDFTCTVHIKDDGADFSGPYVQGPKGTRFLYINIGTSAGQLNSPWTRRLKIPLSGFDTPVKDGMSFTTKVPGTAKDGGPNCATVKPFDGWKRKGKS